MKIDGSVSAYIQNSGQVTNKLEIGSTAANLERAEETKAPLPTESASVTISGRALMLSRLFLTEDVTSEPPVLPGSQGMSQYGLMLRHHFLTRDDRSLLAEMYEFAQEQGADLKHVDRLAWDLGGYRKTNDGRTMANFNNGLSYDLEGRVRTVSFTDKDAATAQRILQGDAINSTQLDQGFLRYTLDPGHGFTHGSDFEFLEQMVIRFSSRGNEAATLDPKFSTYVRIENNYILHTADEVTLHKPAVSEAPTEEDRIRAAMVSLKTTNQSLNERLLDAFFGKRNETATERNLLSRLFELLKTSDTSKKG